MNKFGRNAFAYLLPVLVIAMILSQFGRTVETEKPMSINTLVEHLERKEVKEIKTVGSEVFGVLKDGKDTKFKVFLSDEFRYGFYDNYLKKAVESNEISYSSEEVPQSPWYITMLPTLIAIAAMAGVWYFFMNRSQGGNSKVMNFGKSRAKLNKEDSFSITFTEVAGLKEEKEELSEIVEFLKSPKKFVDIGARIPKGVLLVGPPGTGKTYLSRAVAGEAKVPFFSISGSDFVEMFVGVGASRVRDLFQEAKKNAPCIIFIDEIDAVGRRRGAGMGGGHDEREQTLNQLLVEMDGFGSNEGIIIMAATNRPDILDPALLRPGRFDRQVYVGIPDVRERLEILQVHTKNKKLDTDVNLEDVAKTTTGFTPADLENLTNEAALLAARNNLKVIPKWLFDEAAIKVVAGPEKKSRVVIEKERVLTAYHEAGHAIVTTMLPDTDPVHMITIIPRGRAGGFTAFIPEEDRSYMTKKGYQHELISLLGGRAAEALVLDDISTGASNDIERATKIARAMTMAYGMSDRLGPINYGTDSEDVFMGRDYGKARNYSEEIAEVIDQEIHRLIDDAYRKALSLLEEKIDVLHEVAKDLLEKETLKSEDYMAIFKRVEAEHISGEPPKELLDVKAIDQKIEKTLEHPSDSVLVEENTDDGAANNV